MVTIGVCVKDSERTIKEAIESIINQKFAKELIQLIIVDGCSRDKTLPIVAGLTAKAPIKVELYSDKSRGLSVARQIVVNRAKGKYIIFADADVRLFDDFVRAHVDFMEKNPHAGMAFGSPMLHEGTLVSKIWALRIYADCRYSGTGATIYRSEVLRQVGGFDLNIRGAAEDTDLISKIREKGWLILNNQKARFFHKNKENLLEFWIEQSWFGYGGHYVNHNNKNVAPLWESIPFRAFAYGFKIALKAYELTTEKKSFFIPAQMLLGNISWWFGFIKGHLDAYGH